MSLAGLRALYLRHPTVVTYMLQSTEYEIGPYLRWYWRTQDFSRVMHRRVLDKTSRAKILQLALRVGMTLQVLLGATMIVITILQPDLDGFIAFGLAIVISFPIVWAHLVVIPLLLAKWLIVGPKNQKSIEASEKIFASHPAQKIAIAGSYGKTTMKELLVTVLGEGRRVAATPANKNVASSHAQFAKKLHGDEEVLILEYGEGAPGDVTNFARTTHPSHAVITGLAPAHLDKYKTLERAAEDIFSVADFVKAEQVYVNGDSEVVAPYLKYAFRTYTEKGIDGWKIHDIEVGLDGTRFVLSRGSTRLRLQSGLIGRHQVGPLSAAAVLALSLGLTNEQIERGIAKTTSYEHRMQPYRLGGTWIIDDTYNGNLEGIRAGTALLAELPATRKWYVTPGLVDQGKDTATIHTDVGRLIAAAKPDIVVLMKNSVTPNIQAGLTAGGYSGEIRIEDRPLEFYTNLEQFVTAGDVVLLQNDWTDNYA